MQADLLCGCSQLRGLHTLRDCLQLGRNITAVTGPDVKGLHIGPIRHNKWAKRLSVRLPQKIRKGRKGKQ
jgi:hypothetical protein